MEKQTHIYTLADPRNGQIRYVGKANNIKRRYYLHCNTFTNNTKKEQWIKSLKNNGLIPIMEILDTVNVCDWQFWEIHYISLMKSFGFNLTNHTNGGGGPVDFKNTKPTTEKTREKMRQIALNRSPEQIQRAADARRGIKPTPITIQNLRNAHKNQTNSNLRKAIIQLDMNNNQVDEFVSISEASRKLTGNAQASGNIVKALKRNTKMYNSLWIYKS